MMQQEFMIELDRLKSVYGEKAYPEERVKILWNEFKTYEIARFKKAVDFLVAENFNAPPISKIRDAMFYTPNASSALKQAPDYDCSWCGQSGVVTVFRKKDRAKFTLRCPCDDFGKQKHGERIPVWKESFFKSFDLGPSTAAYASEPPKRIWHKSESVKESPNVELPAW